VDGIFNKKEEIEEDKVVEKTQIKLNELQLKQKQINYDKINSIFQNNNPKVVVQPRPQPQQINNVKLNSQTISKIQGIKKRFR
jgi:hypothetical protein